MFYIQVRVRDGSLFTWKRMRPANRIEPYQWPLRADAERVLAMVAADPARRKDFRIEEAE